MALIACRVCNQQISDQTVACPHCGMPVRSVSSKHSQEVTPSRPLWIWGAVGVAAVVVVVLVMVMARMADHPDTQPSQFAAQKSDSPRLQKMARNDGRRVTASQYADKWSFPVTSGEPECIDKAAVLLNTPSGRYLANGAAMDRHGNTYNAREIGVPIPGRANDPRAKLPPPHELLQHGLKLCD